MGEQLSAGSRLAHFRVVAKLGEGGMGEVWRANDTKLGRDVAIKVLPAALSADPEALARFEQEARAVAALSHPNILAIYDFGREGTTAYAVTELLEGQTLRALLEGGPLPPKKAVEYGRQIAEGLAAAHARGIVHRDLKPENLFVARDGHVKILDFGLARQVRPADCSQTSSPTAVRGTEPGTVMGTVGYMAPEQVKGEVSDHRADIFSFGAVLYEMLAGRRAFERPTAAEAMTAILREAAPPLSSVVPAVPPSLERVVEHCLEKRPEDRFQSARDLAFALGGSATDSGRTSGPAQPGLPKRSRPSRALLAGAGGALVLGLAGGALLHRLVSAPAAPRIAEVRYLTYSGHDYSPAASPDGRSVAFRSDRDGRARIWLKQLATGTEVALTSGPLDDFPQFSPDGSTVLFTRLSEGHSSLYRVPLLGGEPRRIVDDALDGSPSSDGNGIAFVRLHAASPGKTGASSLMVSAADGSGARVLTRIDAGIVSPRWSPDGRMIAYAVTAVGAQSFSLRVVDAASGAVRTVVPSSPTSRPWSTAWTPSGELVYSNGQVSAGSLAGTAGRLLVLDPASRRTSTIFASPDSLGRLAVLGAGRLAVESQTVRQNLTEWAGAAAGRLLTFGRASNRQPNYSPDGKWIVFSSDRAGNLDLWAASTATGELRQLTDDATDDWDPGFRPDGGLLWSSNRSGSFEIWTAESDGSGARQLSHDGADAENPAASPDGKWIVYGSTRPGQSGIWRIRADGTEPALVAAGLNGLPEVSPDGQYVLYLGFAPNLLGAKLEAVRLADGKPVEFSIALNAVRPTTAVLGRARWMPGGRSIAFIGQDDKGVNGIYVQEFAPGRDTTATRRRLTGFDPASDAESFGISPDGSRVTIAGQEIVSSLVLIEGLTGLGPSGR